MMLKCLAMYKKSLLTKTSNPRYPTRGSDNKQQRFLSLSLLFFGRRKSTQIIKDPAKRNHGIIHSIRKDLFILPHWYCGEYES